jgi:hypothetical protein
MASTRFNRNKLFRQTIFKIVLNSLEKHSEKLLPKLFRGAKTIPNVTKRARGA